MLTEIVEKVCAFLGRFSPLVVITPDKGGVRLRFGHLHRVLGEGVCWCIPLVDRTNLCFVSEQSIDLPTQTITTGSRSVSISGCIRFRVVDPVKALLVAFNYTDLVTREALAMIAGAVDEEATMDDVEEHVEEALVEQAKRWGLEILRFAITDWAQGPVLRLIQ